LCFSFRKTPFSTAERDENSALDRKIEQFVSDAGKLLSQSVRPVRRHASAVAAMLLARQSHHSASVAGGVALRVRA
jgi:cell division septum initiation protein DivIVA